jgi:hypothetical protein
MKQPVRYSLGAIVDYLGRKGYITKVHKLTNRSPKLEYDYGYYDVYLFKEQRVQTIIFGIHLQEVKLTGKPKDA